MQYISKESLLFHGWESPIEPCTASIDSRDFSATHVWLAKGTDVSSVHIHIKSYQILIFSKYSYQIWICSIIVAFPSSSPYRFPRFPTLSFFRCETTCDDPVCTFDCPLATMATSRVISCDIQKLRGEHCVKLQWSGWCCTGNCCRKPLKCKTWYFLEDVPLNRARKSTWRLALSISGRKPIDDLPICNIHSG